MVFAAKNEAGNVWFDKYVEWTDILQQYTFLKRFPVIHATCCENEIQDSVL